MIRFQCIVIFRCCLVYIPTDSGIQCFCTFTGTVFWIFIFIIGCNGSDDRNTCCICNRYFIGSVCGGSVCNHFCLGIEFHLVIFQSSGNRDLTAVYFCIPVSLIRICSRIVASAALFVVRIDLDIEVQFAASAGCCQFCHQHIVRIADEVFSYIVCAIVIILYACNSCVKIQCSFVVADGTFCDTFEIQVHISIAQVITITIRTCIITDTDQLCTERFCRAGVAGCKCLLDLLYYLTHFGLYTVYICCLDISAIVVRSGSGRTAGPE